MKHKSITKLYEQLTNKEKAILAFSYATEVNEAELQRVHASVPRVMLHGPSPEYSKWQDGLWGMASWWGIEHWRDRSNFAFAGLAAHILLNNDKQEQVLKAVEAGIKAESRLIALDHALDTVCHEHGIVANAVRKLARTEPYKPMVSSSKSDDEYEREVRRILARILTGIKEEPIHQDPNASAH